ncbi:glycosyltransferase [Reyranella sp.]|uniref:glycosyltransferase n=1 Tax=Reyranella sp. TaxID=1929291 RepID=UPI003D0E1319
MQPFLPTVSIVVPTFNESQNLPRLVGLLDRAMGEIPWEVVFVDDDSPDGTWQVAKQLAREDARVRCIRRVGRRGLAGACIEGALSCAAPYVAVMDADLQHDETVLPAMVAKLRSDEAEIVIGSRFVGDGSSGDGFSAGRAFASRIATRLAALLIGRRVSDPMSGFFAVKREVFEAVAPRLVPSGFKILVDILASTRGKVRIAEVGYRFRSRQEGRSKFDARAILDFLGLLLHRVTGGTVPVRFLFFTIVGTTGIAIHLIALRVGLLAGFSFDTAQSMATVAAMTSNFHVNNLLTYSDMKLRGTAALAGLLKFYIVCGVGALANIGVASWLFDSNESWWIAGIAGVVVGATFNYTMSSIIVWRQQQN